MKLTVSTACDFAAIYDGKLSVIGAFDTLASDHFPLEKSICAVALQILWGNSEQGMHTVKVSFMNDDGKKTLNDMDSTITVQIPEGCTYVSTQHVIQLNQLRFAAPGNFQAVVSVDGNAIGDVPFQIVRSQA